MQEYNCPIIINATLQKARHNTKPPAQQNCVGGFAFSYTEKGSTQARPSSHAAMLSAAKLIYGYRDCRFRRLLSLPLLPEVQNRYTFFGQVVAFNKSLDDARCGGVHHFKRKETLDGYNEK